MRLSEMKIKSRSANVKTVGFANLIVLSIIMAHAIILVAKFRSGVRAVQLVGRASE